MNFLIRNEQHSDVDAIATVTRAAFKDHPISRQTEAFIIQALRADAALTVSLVAELAETQTIIGHAAFSPVTISDGSTNWHGLGPISVLPEYQRKSVGSTLVRKGLALLKELGSQGCVLVGPPQYYERFGFKNSAVLLYPGIPQEFFLVLPFYAGTAQGTVAFHHGFAAVS